MIDDRAVEAAARAIALADGVEPDGEIFDAETGVVMWPAWKYYETGARAALTAAAPFLTPQIPDGWKLVPVEPTEEMVEAHFIAHAEAETVFAEVPALWAAMLAAAPLPPPPQERTDG